MSPYQHTVLWSSAQSNLLRSHTTALIPHRQLYLCAGGFSRGENPSQSSYPALFKFAMQHWCILPCVHSATQEMESEPNSSLKLTRVPTNFLCYALAKGPFTPSGPAGTAAGLFTADLPT